MATLTLLFLNTDLLIAIVTIASSLISALVTIIIVPIIIYTFKREVRRLDNVEVDVDDIKNNYKAEFGNVKKDIADLKEANAEHFGKLQTAIGKIETTVQMTNRHNKEN